MEYAITLASNDDPQLRRRKQRDMGFHSSNVRYRLISFTNLLKLPERREPFLVPKKVTHNIALHADIAALRVRIGRKLSYFGLASPWMRDVELWRHDLACVHVVEKWDKYYDPIVARAVALNIAKISITQGDLGSVALEADRISGLPGMPFDIVNADFCAELTDSVAAGLAKLVRAVAAHPGFGGELLLAITARVPESDEALSVTEAVDRLRDEGMSAVVTRSSTYRGDRARLITNAIISVRKANSPQVYDHAE